MVRPFLKGHVSDKYILASSVGMEVDRYIGIAFGLANVLTMVDTSNAELQAIRNKARVITESIVGKQIVMINELM